MAEDGESDPKPIPLEVLAAHERGDQKALARLAVAAGQGSWLVVEELGNVRGGPAAALAFAKVWNDADQPALLRYVAARAGKRHKPEDLRAFVEARQAVRTKRPSVATILLKSTSFDEDSVFGMWVRETRADVLVLTDRGDEAFLLYRKAADAAQRIGWRSRAARVLLRAAEMATEEGDITGAQSVRQRRYNLLRSRGDLRKAASCKADIATNHATLEDFASARRHFLEAISELGKAGKRDHAALTRSNLGLLHLRLGEYERALTQFETAVEELERAVGEGRVKRVPDLARAVSSLGTVRRDLGQNEEALALHLKAVALMRGHLKKGERRSRSESLALAIAVGNCGGTRMVRGEYAQAANDLAEALDIFETELKSSYGVALALVNLAELAFLRKDFIGATTRVQAALKHFGTLGAERLVAEQRMMLGRILAARGKRSEAEAMFSVVQASAQRLRLHAVVVAAMTERAELALAAGKTEEAGELAFGAVDVLGSSLAHLADGEGADAREARLRTYQLPIRVALVSGDAVECAEALDLARAGTFLEAMGGRAALREYAFDAGLRKRIDDARVAEEIAWAGYRRAVRSRVHPRKIAAQKRVDRARTRTQTVHDALERTAKHGRDLVYPRADELAEIQLELAPSDALVVYGLLEKRSVALVVTHEDAFIRPLASGAAIRMACDDLLLEKAPYVDQTKAGALAKLIIEPLKLDPKVKRILISPDGILTYVPFALLMPKHALAYVPSGTAYRMMRTEAQAHKQGKGIVAFGDPAYSEHTDRRRLALYRTSFGGKLKRLKASGDEAREVGKGGEVHVRKEATEANLRKAVRPRRKRKRLRALHIAGHGMANAENPQLSCLALAPSGKDDGYLLAREVMALEIPVDLVVLSACESVRGKVVRAEGLQGLTRAFLFAGASSVMASLWKVNDDATKVFMVKFYSLWNPRTGDSTAAAEALRLTQEHMRTKTQWKDPKHWAAWVLWGLPD